jgi:hypothetical protein
MTRELAVKFLDFLVEEKIYHIYASIIKRKYGIILNEGLESIQEITEIANCPYSELLNYPFTWSEEKALPEHRWEALHNAWGSLSRGVSLKKPKLNKLIKFKKERK